MVGKKTAVLVAMVLGTVLVPARAAVGQAVSALPKLDLSRYMGTWYEIARLPYKREKECLSDAITLYAPAYKPNHFHAVTSCQIKSNNSDSWNAGGVMDKTGAAKFKLTYVWPFTEKYWVLAVGPEYEWALLGSPNRKALWVLSRTAVMKPEVLADIQAKAAAEGFTVAKLVMVPQRH